MSRADSTAVRQRQPRDLVSVLPAARAGGAELTAAEQQILEGFRLMNDSSRATMLRFFNKQAERDREARATRNAAGLRLVGGGA